MTCAVYTLLLDVWDASVFVWHWDAGVDRRRTVSWPWSQRNEQLLPAQVRLHLVFLSVKRRKTLIVVVLINLCILMWAQCSFYVADWPNYASWEAERVWVGLSKGCQLQTSREARTHVGCYVASGFFTRTSFSVVMLIAVRRQAALGDYPTHPALYTRVCVSVSTVQ